MEDNQMKASSLLLIACSNTLHIQNDHHTRVVFFFWCSTTFLPRATEIHFVTLIHHTWVTKCIEDTKKSGRIRTMPSYCIHSLGQTLDSHVLLLVHSMGLNMEKCPCFSSAENSPFAYLPCSSSGQPALRASKRRCPMQVAPPEALRSQHFTTFWPTLKPLKQPRAS